ncbi:MAG: T9SS type A sorting domain-containing protein [Chitinophagales bacterium]
MPKIKPLFLLLFLNIGVFAQVEYNMQNATVTDCSGILYDSGGPDGDYGSDENFIFTICPDPVPACIRLDLGTVIMESISETLSVYDGKDVSDTLILFHTYFQNLPVIEANSGCITIEFKSDANSQGQGWKADWQCFSSECEPKLRLPNEQDCDGAIVICEEVYNSQKTFVREGNVVDEINGGKSCLKSGERNSVWYKLRIVEDGDLAFSLIPDDFTDDYDWAVFNITDADCGDIFNDSTLLVSCNYSSDMGITGATGATNQTSGGGPDSNQNAVIPVKKGEIYVINVSQFSPSLKGYIMDFSASTVSIGENSAPVIGAINDFLEGIDSETLQLNFTDDIQCQSIEDMVFQIEGYELTNETLCNESGYASIFVYTIEPELELGFHDLKIVGTIANVCGNTSFWDEIINFQITETTVIDPTLQSQLRFYPNPTTETIFVDLPQLSSKNILIEVYNIEGKQLQSLPILSQKMAVIDVSNYSKGIYYLKVNVGDGHWTEKVVVR